jgi:hypothetical protein
LAAALGDDPNFATTIATSIGTKQPQLNGTGFVKISGTTISYDNSTYLTSASLTGYVPYSGATGAVNLGNYNLTIKEIVIGTGAKNNTNIAIGRNVMSYSSGGTGNVAIGVDALYFDQSDGSVVIGYEAGYYSNQGRNVTIGYQAGRGNGPGSNSIAVGYQALTANTNGSNNIALGYLAGSQLVGSNNTIIGGYLGTTMSSNVVIADGAGNIRFQWDGSNIKLNGNTVGSNAYTSTAYLPLAGGTLTGPLTLSTNDQSSSRFKIINTSSTVPLGFSLIAGKAGITHEGFSIYNNTAARTDLYIAETGEVSVYNFFNVTKADQAVMYLNNSTRAGGLGRDWGILNGNLGAGIFSIKDETAAANRFSIATDGVVTSNVSALIGIATDASAYMRISENQIWRTGGGALYINNSGTGSVIIAGGGGAITLGTSSQSGSNLLTTKDMGITGSNTYFGTGQVRIGGGSDHTTNVVLSVAPGVVNFDRPGVAGGAFKINSDGTSTFGKSVTISAGTLEAFVFGVNSNSTFAFGSTNGRRAAIIAHESVGDSGLQFGWDTVDKTGIIAGSANSTGAGIDFYAYDGSSWANRMRMTKNGVLGIGVNPSTSDWGTRSAIMLGGFGTALSSYNGGGGATELLHNAIITSGFTAKYAITAASTKQYMDGNNVVWFRAPIGTAGAAITYTQLANLNSTGLAIGGTGDPSLRLSVYSNGSTITSGNVTFASQAKGIEIYNDSGSGTTDNLVGCWFSTGPHKAGIASGRTNAASNWAVDLRFFVHGPEIASLDNTYEKMRLYGEGNLTINGSLTQTGSLSDITLKENLVKIITPLQKISQISGYTFTWKENAPARQHISNIVEDAGLIAQEVELILPEIVRTNEDGSKALNYNGVVGLLVEAMKELKVENDLLKNRLDKNNIN